jgi:ATP-dependent helicase HrpB
MCEDPRAMGAPLQPLPVDALLGEACAALVERHALVLRAPTGSGKTTRVPPAIEAAGLGPVLLVEPRRVAARAAARRMAAERGEDVGRSVGYRVRFDKCVSRATKITAVTEGLFLRQILADPFLEGVGCVVFDEFHERHLDGDLGLALARKVQREARDDLAIVVLSATIDPAPLVDFLDAAVIDAPGKLFPVEVAYQAPRGREQLEEQVVRALAHAGAWLEAQREGEQGPKPGRDMLVFLPGKGEIRRCEEALTRGAGARLGLEVQTLHGELDARAQDRVLAPRRAGDAARVILATNLAESSVTIDGLGAVIDSGLARFKRLDSEVGLDRLELGNISMPSVVQRMGRAGRTGPGLNLRLWSPAHERTLAPGVEPEVARVDLAAALLALADFGEAEPLGFDWFEAPPAAPAALGLELLRSIGALDTRGITSHGRELARLPVHPRLGQLLMAGRSRGVLERAAFAAALLSERDVLRGVLERLEPARLHDSDLLERLEILEGTSHVRAPGWGAREIQRVAQQLQRLVKRSDVAAAEDPDEALLHAVFEAFPDRVARRREAVERKAPRRGRRVAGAGGGAARARMVGGRGLTLGDECRVRETELFVALEVAGRVRGSNEAYVRQASLVRREWLEELEPFEEGLVCAVDESTGRVSPRRVRSWRGLVLDELPVSDVGARELARARAAALAEFAARKPAVAFDLESDACLDLAARVEFVRGRLAPDDPAAPAPFVPVDFAQAHMEELVAGAKTLGELKAQKLASRYLERLDYPTRQNLDRLAPARLVLPNGEGARVHYEKERGAVLRVRIQQLFGWQATPEVGGALVLLELCAPNGRPQQVTDDLAGFWAGSYALVRKDLRGRYPKHPWPEDPASAPPIPPRRRR